MQNQSEEEACTWQVISKIQESWCFDNHGFFLTLKILEKDGKYRLYFSQPANCTEDVFLELSGRPIKWLKELETLPHNKYKGLIGASEYGETNLKGIATALGVEITNQFERSNIS